MELQRNASVRYLLRVPCPVPLTCPISLVVNSQPLAINNYISAINEHQGPKGRYT